MTYKVIKVNCENYEWLLRESLSLESEYGKKVSMNETITRLRQKQNQKLLDLAGSWKMSETEAKNFLKENKSGWKKWKSV